MFKEVTTLNYTLGLEHLPDFRTLSHGVWLSTQYFPRRASSENGLVLKDREGTYLVKQPED